MTYTKQKSGLLTAQVVMHVLFAVNSMLAMLCWVYPSKIDSGVSQAQQLMDLLLCQCLCVL